MDVFDRLAPYIQEYIYRNQWTELREVQVAACEVLFGTDAHLLLSSGTASGKTEAAFLPALTLLYERPAKSVGILYVGPLKALINDQFERLDALLLEGDVPVTKWHGDAPTGQKKKLMKNPRGVLQITPESLESMLMNRRGLLSMLFSDLRFVIIDEVHYFMGNPRGIQLLCLLERLERFCGCAPRRIGLSATISDYETAENWLCAGGDRLCITPAVEAGKKKLRIFMERFAMGDDEGKLEKDDGFLRYREYLYKKTLDKQAILFANSRAEAERTATSLKALAEKRGTGDVYRVHHGSISSMLREETEREMKESGQNIVTAATLTLELGIDIGALDMVVQLGAPFTVSSLAQRIGRCGRRGQPAELLFVILERVSPITKVAGEINWNLLKAVAILELYLGGKWIEPAPPPKLPFSMLYHQTMSCLFAGGEMSPGQLAQRVLRLSPFRNVPKEDYALLLRHLISIDHLMKTERGGLIIGNEGEKIVNHYEFYAVFESPVEYLVKCGSEPIGTIMGKFPAGERFALAGRSWEVIEGNEQSKTISVREVKGVFENTWDSFFLVSLHARVLEKMREILASGEQYGYMSERCQARLDEMRGVAQWSGITDNLITSMGEETYAVFPWTDTGKLYALHYLLKQNGLKSRISPDEMMPVYLTVHCEGGEKVLERMIRGLARSSARAIEIPNSAELPGKFNEFIPKELLKKQYRVDFLGV